MFVEALEQLRRRVPALPAHLADVGVVSRRLEPMRGFAAVDGAQLVGYLTAWFPIEDFRGAQRIGAYAPEWAHAATGEHRRAVQAALYRAASETWAAAGCDTHAITLLADDDVDRDTWFWSGFGMGTVDAIRPMEPLGGRASVGFSVRRATLEDAQALAVLDMEHQGHYSEAPVFMAPRQPTAASAWAKFLEGEGNSAWIAQDAEGPFGFIRFAREFNASSVVDSTEGIFISGAYVQKRARGRGAATAMLDAAFRHYASAGIRSCAVDFEAFNPEASAFWLRHFTPVCTSLMRVPEWRPE